MRIKRRLFGRIIRVSTNHEVADSIHNTSTILKVSRYARVYPDSWLQLGSYFIENWLIWLRKLTLLDLTESSANSISRRAAICQLVAEI